MQRFIAVCVFSALATILAIGPARAATIVVTPGAAVQAAIDGASSGDRIELQAGEYPGNVDFVGKNVELVGVGASTVLIGDGLGPVVTIASGEGAGAIVDSLTITGGVAAEGGGVLIVGASPTIVRNFLIGNQALARGTAIFIDGTTAAPLIANNLMAYNDRGSSGDPHGVQTSNSSPMIINNTLVRSDSNGIFLSGTGSALVMNNIIARNGSRGTKDEARRGRGICNFTATAMILHNNFWKNSKSALLQSGQDFRRVRRAQKFFDSLDLMGNTDRSPRFTRRRLAKDVAQMELRDFTLRPNSRAIGAGNPDSAYNNLDGSTNTMGHLGGPLAAP